MTPAATPDGAPSHIHVPSLAIAVAIMLACTLYPRLFKFLSGWFGGPSLFIQERGHPRLRMRHAPYAVGPTERDESERPN